MIRKQDNRFDYMRSYARYFGLVIQMILLIVIGGFGGRALDRYFHLTTPILTIILILLATILSFYLFFKTILK